MATSLLTTAFTVNSLFTTECNYRKWRSQSESGVCDIMLVDLC